MLKGTPTLTVLLAQILPDFFHPDFSQQAIPHPFIFSLTPIP
jgi:hypothetical protein